MRFWLRRLWPLPPGPLRKRNKPAPSNHAALADWHGDRSMFFLEVAGVYMGVGVVLQVVSVIIRVLA